MKAKEKPMKQRRKKKNPPSFSSLPNDILLNCLARISRSDYRSVSLVFKSIRSLLSCPELHTSRSLIGNTEPCLYVRQELATYDRWYALDRTLITDSDLFLKDETSLSPIMGPSSSYDVSKSTTVAIGFEIYQMGGTKEPSSAVGVLDCRTHMWRDAPKMTVARKGAQSCFIDGKIYVTGGTEDIMNWCEVFDLKTQSWKLLPSPPLPIDAQFQFSNDGRMFYVSNLHQAYLYDSKQGRWKEDEYLNFGQLSEKKPCCFIDNVKFILLDLVRSVLWYDSESRHCRVVKGLEGLNMKGGISYSAFKFATYGGKLVIMWDEPRPLLEFPVAGKKKKYRCINKTVWCAVIRLEKRIDEIWGEVERCNPVLIVPNSYHVLTSITL